MAVELLSSHLVTQHNVYQYFVTPGTDQTGSGNGTTWTACFFPAEGNCRCPVPNRLQGQEEAGCKPSFNVCYYFAYRHRLQVGTAGTPEHLSGRTCREMTAQWQQHEVAAASAAAL